MSSSGADERARPAATGRHAQIGALLALILLAIYVTVWAGAYGPLLVDPQVQNNDARTTLFPFHQYGAERELADDPVAQEMLGFSPPPVRWIYRALVPVFGVLTSAKIVQGLGFILVVLAGWLLARRQGLAAGVLLVFLLLHETFVVQKMAGGLPRSFAFPALALWIVGSLDRQPRVRACAAVLAALTYPSVLLLILAAEGIHEVLGLRDRKAESWVIPAKRYLVLTGLCFLIVSPMVLFPDPSVGPVHSLEEAQEDPAFGPQGRLKVLPFQDPIERFDNALLSPFRPQGRPPSERIRQVVRPYKREIGYLGLGLCILLVAARAAPFPRAAISLLLGSVVLYAAARVLAFRLYSPIRFPDYGALAAGIALMVSSFGLIAYRRRPPSRELIRGVVVCLVMVTIWFGLGTGIVSLREIGTVNARGDTMLRFVATLPIASRVAAHPRDADNVPLFAARAVVVSYETLQPWFKDSWARQKQRAEATLRAVYAEDLKVILDYAEEYGVTHFLIMRNRYTRRIVAKSKTFQPLTDYARQLIGRRTTDDFYFSHPPGGAVIYDEGPFLVVEVERLRELAGPGET